MRYSIWIFALSMGVWFQTTDFGWNWDDEAHIFGNPYFLNPSWNSLKQIWVAPYFGLYIPVTYSIWFAFSYLFQNIFDIPLIYCAPGFHLINILIHSLNSVLFYNVLVKIGKGGGVGLLSSLIFMVHPFQIESVSWVSEFRGLLSSSFILLLILLSLPTKGEELKWGVIKVVHLTVISSLALLSKPTSLVIILFLLWLYYKNRTFKFLIPIATSLFVFWIIIQMEFQNSELYSLNLWGKLVHSIHNIGFYYKKFLFPIEFKGVYPYNLEFPNLSMGYLFFGFLVITLLGFISWKNKSQLPIFLVPLCVLFPYLGFKGFLFQKTSLVADRYAYLFVAGFVSVILFYLTPKLSKQLPILLLGFFSVLLTQNQKELRYWKFPDIQWARIQKSSTTHSLGYYQISQILKSNGDWLNSYHFTKAAFQFEPKNQKYHKEMLLIEAKLGVKSNDQRLEYGSKFQKEYSANILESQDRYLEALTDYSESISGQLYSQKSCLTFFRLFFILKGVEATNASLNRCNIYLNHYSFSFFNLKVLKSLSSQQIRAEFVEEVFFKYSHLYNSYLHGKLILDEEDLKNLNSRVPSKDLINKILIQKSIELFEKDIF